jgi:AcrR family transcriptional regulator
VIPTNRARKLLVSRAGLAIIAPVSKADATRLAIIRAAEKLFAENGVDAVSLREVAFAAGQRNHAAARYHFQTKERLVDACLERHAQPIQSAWMDSLAANNGHGPPPEPRRLVDLFVRPIVAKLDDADGGWQYLCLTAQLVISQRYPMLQRPVARAPGWSRIVEALSDCAASVKPNLLGLRVQRVAAVLFTSIMEYGRLEKSSQNDKGLSREVFISDLVDTLTSLLTSAASNETLMLIARDIGGA